MTSFEAEGRKRSPAYGESKDGATLGRDLGCVCDGVVWWGNLGRVLWVFLIFVHWFNTNVSTLSYASIFVIQPYISSGLSFRRHFLRCAYVANASLRIEKFSEEYFLVSA